MSNKPKKIALIGTSSIGKTTLLYELKNEIISNYPEKKIITVSEAAREYFSDNFVTDPFSFLAQQQVQLLAQRKEKDVYIYNPDIIITDRSVFDAVAYLHAMGDSEGSIVLHNDMKEWLRTYESFFLLDPVGVPYVTDDIRKESEETRQRFHEAFVHLLSKTDLPWYLISGTKRDRIQSIITRMCI